MPGVDPKSAHGTVFTQFHVALNQGLPQRLHELDPTRTTVVVCHHGVRSFQVALWLERNGFTDVANLSGGIDAWARQIEPGMAVY